MHVALRLICVPRRIAAMLWVPFDDATTIADLRDMVAERLAATPYYSDVFSDISRIQFVYTDPFGHAEVNIARDSDLLMTDCVPAACVVRRAPHQDIVAVPYQAWEGGSPLHTMIMGLDNDSFSLAILAADVVLPDDQTRPSSVPVELVERDRGPTKAVQELYVALRELGKTPSLAEWFADPDGESRWAHRMQRRYRLITLLPPESNDAHHRDTHFTTQVIVHQSNGASAGHCTVPKPSAATRTSLRAFRDLIRAYAEMAAAEMGAVPEDTAHYTHTVVVSRIEYLDMDFCTYVLLTELTSEHCCTSPFLRVTVRIDRHSSETSSQ